jgi:hypothetical protein
MHRYITGPQETPRQIDLIDGKGYLYRSTIQSVKGKELYLQVPTRCTTLMRNDQRLSSA